LELHIDLDNCPDWLQSLAVWDHIYLDNLKSWATVLLVDTACHLVKDYYTHCDSLCGGPSELIQTYHQESPMTKDIAAKHLCCKKPHAIIPLHYDPMVHALVAIHCLNHLPPGSQTKDIGIKLIAAFLSTNNPLIFH
jgi:hypothetical protein